MSNACCDMFYLMALHVQHPFLQRIEDIEHVERDGFMVIIVQPLQSRGSLKDLIYEVIMMSSQGVKLIVGVCLMCRLDLLPRTGPTSTLCRVTIPLGAWPRLTPRRSGKLPATDDRF